MMNRRMLLGMLLLYATACRAAPQDASASTAAQAPGEPDATGSPASSAGPRRVVISIDDLPAHSTSRSVGRHDSITTGLLATFADERVPAIGFVNENKLVGNDGEIDPARVALLERWAAAGLDLGNHSYSHPDLHDVSLAAYQEDILRGERVTRPVLARHGRTPRWFRHPFLHAGMDTAVQADMDAFLAKHGYAVAPVTIDNHDYVFAAAFDRALDRADSALALRVVTSYIAYMDTVFGFYEQQSRSLLGYELPQVLLLHANRLNAQHLDDLIRMMRGRGYSFVSMAEAMEDPAYRRPSGYTGPAGISWIQRWAMAEQRPRAFYLGEPLVPPFVMEASRARPAGR